MRQRLCVLVTLALLLAGCDPAPRTPAAQPATPPAAPTQSSGPITPASPQPTGSQPVKGCARTVAALSLEDRVGQLLMIGAPVADPRSLTGAVGRYHLGGVFLAGRSTRSAAELRADVGALQSAAGRPLLIALDQEGGDVQTLKGPDFPVIPSALRLGAGPSSALRAEVAGAARRLAGIGVNLNLAPVADTVPAALGEGNPPIGAFHREYGSDPVKVAAAIRTVVPASQQAGVLTTLKHFPGLGRTRFNTDTTTKAVDTVTTTTDPYLGPFAAGIGAGSAAVMISSASYPRLDHTSIAAFSAPVITGLLRTRLHFNGLVMSDDLGAAAAVRSVPVGERAVRFVRAGGDLVLSIRPEDAAPMTTALLAEARRSPAFATQVTVAATHVLSAKVRAGLPVC